MFKYEIARELAKRCGLTSYLEICTAMTGFTFGKVDQTRFPICQRLMYRCPEDFSDGAEVHFSTPAESSEALCGEILRSGQRFDLVFVDSWHAYETSLRDLVFGLQLIKQNGLLLVHDCSPPTPESAEPENRPGEWCGVTYAAFLDLVLPAENLPYATVDSDYGCAMISKHPRLSSLVGGPPDAELVSQWHSLDLNSKYPFFDSHRKELLRLISVDEFRHHLKESV